MTESVVIEQAWRGEEDLLIIPPTHRRGDRVADCAGLENRCPARDRGFKSHPLRLVSTALNEFQQDASCCTGNGLRLVVSEEIEDADFAVARNHSQPKSAARAKSGANSGPVKPDDSPPTVEQVRELVQECAALPDHIRAAMLALLGTV
jgi:hypothetical protein